MKIELLPSKEFELHLSSGNVVKGKFGTWVVQRFCIKRNISLIDFMEKFSPDGISKLRLDDITDLFLCCAEYIARKEKVKFEYTDLDACEWLEEMGGINSELYNKLFGHFGSDIEGQVDEKKSP